MARKKLIRALNQPSLKHKPRFDPTELLAELSTFSRQPFIEVLAEILQCIPTPDALQIFADEHPDRWANAVNTMSKLAGYEQGMDVDGNVLRDLTKLGDAQLIQRLAEVEDKLKELGLDAKVVDGTVVEGGEQEVEDGNNKGDKKEDDIEP